VALTRLFFEIRAEGSAKWRVGSGEWWIGHHPLSQSMPDRPCNPSEYSLIQVNTGKSNQNENKKAGPNNATKCPDIGQVEIGANSRKSLISMIVSDNSASPADGLNLEAQGLRLEIETDYRPPVSRTKAGCKHDRGNLR
jgi:hypothetical protein